MHAVRPKEDCPHIENQFSRAYDPSTIKIPCPCKHCADESENWICLKCYEVNCSRYVNSHQQEHYQQTGHCVAASFSDLSVWCYECDSYIKNPVLTPLLRLLCDIKFPLEKVQALDESEEEETKQEIESSQVKSESEEEEEESDEDISLDLLRKMAQVSMGQQTSDEPTPTTYLESLNIEGVAKALKEGKAKKIIVMTGAGISVAAGIPDFRTPGTGLYDNLQKYGLPHPTAVFEIDYFRKRPEPFYLLAKELYPGNFKPTAVHYFIRLLDEKGLLLRNFTQNIDTLERVAKVRGEALVEAHGAFAEAHCIDCKQPEDIDVVKKCVFSDAIPRCKNCNGLVKPDIVFFGESLPSRFFEKLSSDFPECDLLVVIGTSLQVQPFASLVSRVGPHVPRVLINREVVGTTDPILAMLGLGSSSGSFRFNQPSNYRDVAVIGDCQEGVLKLAELCGWKDELENLMK